jgi:hypothetical protein
LPAVQSAAAAAAVLRVSSAFQAVTVAFPAHCCQAGAHRAGPDLFQQQLLQCGWHGFHLLMLLLLLLLLPPIVVLRHLHPEPGRCCCAICWIPPVLLPLQMVVICQR